MEIFRLKALVNRCSEFIGCGLFSDTEHGGCFKFSGPVYWTAGHRIYPSRESAFVWRVTSTSSYETHSPMRYTNWDKPAEPSYTNNNEACVCLVSERFFKWHDYRCWAKICSVCELDI